ncbi:hypothetical protein ACVWV0_002386 [Ewingella americana]
MKFYLPFPTKQKTPAFRLRFLTLFDAWQVMNHCVLHPAGRCYATFISQNRCPKGKKPPSSSEQGGFFV